MALGRAGSEGTALQEHALGAPKSSRREDLIRRIQEIGPWHMGVQLTEDLNSGQAFSDDGAIRDRDRNNGVSLLQLRDNFLKQVDAIYPEGLAGKRFLDCACNAGGYCFWAAERGVQEAFGFDVREHWIRQAEFIKQHRMVAPTDNLHFAVCDLYDVPKQRLQPFDFTMFKGIFYHLPDPVAGLKIAADLTTEVLFLNTSTTWGEQDGYMKCGLESKELVMSGVHGLRWYPTGPQVLAEILRWMGFVELKQTFFIQEFDQPHLGRVEIIASKKQGLLATFPGTPM